MGFGDAARGQHSWTLDEEHSREIIKRGLELGVNFYDTAIAYQSGTSEQYVGRALRDFAKREDVVLATKFLPRTPEEIEKGITGDRKKERNKMAEKIVQTAGRDQLGEFAPMFAHLNDDVLFGEVWNEEAIDVKTKCIITVVSLMASGITDSSLSYHLRNAKAHGVTKEEIAAIITHATMYVGWPKGWAVFRLAKEVWNESDRSLQRRTDIRIQFVSR